MHVNVDEIFERLLEAWNSKTLKELSLKLGYKANWASNCRLKGITPWEVCLKTATEKYIRLDYLIFGVEEEIDEHEKEQALRKDVTNGLFNIIKTQTMNLQEDKLISDAVEMMMSQLYDYYAFDNINKKFMFDALVEKLKTSKNDSQ